ncbi:MAG: TonB-dependent receptor [Bacteroidota bacterium]
MRFLFLLFFCLGHLPVFTQSTTLQGVVFDATSRVSIPYATIALLHNDTIVGGTLTDEEGKFSMHTSTAFTAITFSFVGYETFRIDKSNLISPNDIQVGLQTSTEYLEEVVIEGERTISQIAIDRKVIHLGADLQQAGTTALEAFDQIPDVQTDLSTGTLSLRGSSNVRVLINGKPSGMATGELLNQIPSSSIERIEIITAPSAKNQADGIAGIINIILKKDTTQGLNLTLDGGVGIFRHHYGVAGNYSTSWLNTRFNGHRSFQKRTSYQTLRRRYTNDDTENIFTPHEFDGEVNRLSLGLDVFPHKTLEASLDYKYTDDYHSFYNPSFYTQVTDVDDFIYLRTSEHFHLTHTANANIRYSFAKKDHFIELDYNLNSNDNRFPARDFRNNQFTLAEDYDYDNRLHSLGVDYSLPVTNTLMLEAGFAWNKRSLQSAYVFNDIAINSQDAFDYGENIYAGYLQGRWRFSKFTLQAGLRYEYFYSESTSTQPPLDVQKSFSNLFPSWHLSYQLTEGKRLNLGYSRRVARPNFRHLNPFQLGNPYFRFEGNADLVPEFSDNIDISYQYNVDKLDCSLSSFFRARNEVIQRIDRFSEEGVQIASYVNGGRNNTVGIEANLNYVLLPFWTSSIAGNYFYTHIEEEALVTWAHLYSAVIQWRNTFKLSKQFSLDISYRHDPKRQQAFRYYESRNRLDGAFSARFLKGKLSGNLRVIDLLNHNPQKRVARTSTVEQRETWIFATQTRNFLLSVTYRLFEKKGLQRNRKKRDYRHGGTTD